MHGNRVARRRHGDLEHADKLIFKNNFVTVRSGLHRVVAIREIRLVLSVSAKMPGEQYRRNQEQRAEKSSASFTKCKFAGPHGAEYT